MNRRYASGALSRQPMLPNFLVIGAAKAGTTSLYRYLSAHPRVFMSATKEINFFVQEENWNRGLAWYGKQFEGGEKALALGEATPHYTMHPVYRGVPSASRGTSPKRVSFT